MSAKNRDNKNRWRNITVGFRVSPEENERINKAVALSGLPKQEYCYRRCLNQDVVVQGNPRVYKALKQELAAVLAELQRIEAGNSVDEAVMRLYAAYCRAAGDSRKCCFSFVMNCLRNQREGNPPLIRRMFDNAVCLCADVIATVYLLAAGTETPPRSCLLSDLEPYRFPVGGFGAYRFRFWETDRAYGSDGAVLPLKLEGEHGECVFSHGLSFGTHYHGDLCYRIASGVFRSFACTVGLHPASPAQGWISLDIINRGTVAESFQIGPECRSRAVRVNAPSGDFGFRFRSLPGNGIVVVGDPVFLPEKA